MNLQFNKTIAFNCIHQTGKFPQIPPRRPSSYHSTVIFVLDVQVLSDEVDEHSSSIIPSSHFDILSGSYLKLR
jgi:hypothetical protein